MKLKFFAFINIILLSGIFNLAWAENHQDQLAKILLNFRKGAYLQTIDQLKPLRRQQKTAALAHYWTGLCYSRLQEYDKAIPEFKQALRLKAQAKDIYYEFGQSLYASLSYKRARKAFLKSAQIGFKRPTSIYYIGYISQALEEYDMATKYYRQLNQLDGVSDPVLQAANFQMAEVLLVQAEKKKKPANEIKEVVLPQFSKALDIDDDSSTGKDIAKRISEIKKKYELGPERWVSGKIIPTQKHRIYLRQRITYDDNVLLESDNATTKVDKDSFVFQTTGFGRYTWIEQNRIGLSPEVKLTNTYHSKRKQPSIYTNDSYSIAPAIRTQVHHKLFNQAANIIFDIEYNYTARDRRSKKRLQFYGSSVAYVVGESFRFLSFGDTQLRFKYKNYTSFIETSNSVTKSLLFTQNILLPNKHFMIFNTNMDFSDTTNDQNSTNTYTSILNYIVSSFLGIQGLSFNTGFTFTLLDTKKQRPTRGLERTYSPSVTLDYSLTNHIQLSLDYTYTKKNSKNSPVYAYAQNVYGLQFEYNF